MTGRLATRIAGLAFGGFLGGCAVGAVAFLIAVRAMNEELSEEEL